ncbi:hypothetical protein HDV00_006639 [Rhizophlyctis rosea]|nr:hypothetical protein HDV00_006639 [Rhizophlyctis rosea]
MTSPPQPPSTTPQTYPDASPNTQTHTPSSYDPYATLLATVTQRVKEGLAQATDARKQKVLEKQKHIKTTASRHRSDGPRGARRAQFMDDESDESEEDVDEFGWEEGDAEGEQEGDTPGKGDVDLNGESLHPFRTDLELEVTSDNDDDDNNIPTNPPLTTIPSAQPLTPPPLPPLPTRPPPTEDHLTTLFNTHLTTSALLVDIQDRFIKRRLARSTEHENNPDSSSTTLVNSKDPTTNPATQDAAIVLEEVMRELGISINPSPEVVEEESNVVGDVGGMGLTESMIRDIMRLPLPAESSITEVTDHVTERDLDIVDVEMEGGGGDRDVVQISRASERFRAYIPTVAPMFGAKNV